MNSGRNANRSGNSKVVLAFIFGGLIGGLSVAQFVPNLKTTDVAKSQGAVIENDPGSAPVPGATTGGSEGPVSGGVVAPPPQAANLKCAPGLNGGATDQGVTGSEIRLATTVVESGIGRPFLRDVRFAMEAVKENVNRAGGICGRKLKIQYIDDGWSPDLGAQFLRTLINEPNKDKKIFAIPVGPSSEGLRLVIHSGDIDRAQMPVVGADGMLMEQYVKEDGTPQRWVSPVAAATVASARIMAVDALKDHAKTFGIVFDKNYRFGQEAAKAFNAEVKRLTGKDILGFNKDNNCEQRYCGIQAGQSNYPNEVREYFREKVDFTALFLEPQTALTWMTDPNTPAARQVKYGAAQPLFTRDFASNCRDKCDQMKVWTGFKPNIESYKADPAVQAYVNDMARTNPQADVFNAFAVGGYVGMKLLVEGLKAIGPYVTRERLRQALDNIKLDTGLTIQPALQWRPGVRYVNTQMQGFIIQYKNTFAGWREGLTGSDPCPACGTN